MKARVITPFNAWAPEEHQPRDFANGEELEASLAWHAVRCGFAEASP
jgi:hypothetical protein